MAYITVATFLNSYPPDQLSGALAYGSRQSATTGSYLQTLIDEQSSWVDTYLAEHHDVPVSPVPAVLQSITKHLVFFELMTQTGNQVDDATLAIINANNGYLTLLQQGKVTLPGVDANDESGIGGSYAGPATTESDDPNFLSLAHLKGTFL